MTLVGFRYLTFNLISREQARNRELKASMTVARAKPQKKEKYKKSKKAAVVDESDLPEVDQNTNKNLRNRAQKLK